MNRGMAYNMALAYTADWPENPYRGDERFLASAIAGIEESLDPEMLQTLLSDPPNRTLQGTLLAYDLLKDKVPPAVAKSWNARLTGVIEGVVRVWLVPAEDKLSCYSDDVGTGTNHWAYHMANVYAAGKVLGRPEWAERAAVQLRKLSKHGEDGYFCERRDVPTRYTTLTTNGLGQYYWQSGDETVVATLARCTDYAVWMTAPNREILTLFDGRVSTNGPHMGGEFVWSLTGEGRTLARERVLERVAGRKPSETGLEMWFRYAEDAVNFREGEERPLPTAGEYALLDGRGLVARAGGFTCGLSAICVPPIDGLFRTDPQNAVELHHASAGAILRGNNSQHQPEAGSFMRTTKAGTEYLPTVGHVERLGKGHVAVLDFPTFSARVRCEVLGDGQAEVTVELLRVTGDEPVVYSFFPGARGQELEVDAEGKVLKFRSVTMTASRAVKVEKDFKIFNPYSDRREVGAKPFRAWVELRKLEPFVLRISVEPPKAAN
jgi:hypothetical protein